MKIFILFLMIGFWGCKSDDQKVYEEKMIKVNQLKQVLEEKYKPLDFDTLYRKYSFEINGLLKMNKIFKVENFDIADIISEDSLYLLQIETYSPDVLLNIRCDKTQIDKILAHENSSILILSLDSLKKLNFEFYAYDTGEYLSSDETLDIDLELSRNKYIGKGKLIAIENY